MTSEKQESQIRDVWMENFYEELAMISSLVDTNEYNVISFVSTFSDQFMYFFIGHRIPWNAI